MDHLPCFLACIFDKILSINQLVLIIFYMTETTGIKLGLKPGVTTESAVPKPTETTWFGRMVQKIPGKETFHSGVNALKRAGEYLFNIKFYEKHPYLYTSIMLSFSIAIVSMVKIQEELLQSISEMDARVERAAHRLVIALCLLYLVRVVPTRADLMSLANRLIPPRAAPPLTVPISLARGVIKAHRIVSDEITCEHIPRDIADIMSEYVGEDVKGAPNSIALAKAFE